MNTAINSNTLIRLCRYLYGLVFVLIVLGGLAATPVSAAENDHDHKGEKARQLHSDGKDHDDQGQPGIVELKPESLRAQGVVVQAIQPQSLGDLLIVSAEVKFNERRRVVVTARSSGWTHKVAVFDNQRVRRNQFLASIYSPEFLSAQHEYLLILNRNLRADAADEKENASLLADAKQRLRILGLTDKEIDLIGTTRQTYKYQHIHSPIPGIVIEHKINSGDTIQPGQKLYVIADLRTVWVQLSLTEAQLGRVRRGQRLTLTVKAYPGRRFVGRVLSLGANVDEATRTVKARALVKNTGGLLKPGMFATAEINLGGGKPVMAVPQAAVLRSPDGDWVVFVEVKPGSFRPEEVKRLRTVGDWSVISGLKPGTRVVVKGAFFIQSELAKSGFQVDNY